MKIGIDARLWSETGVGRYIRNLVKHLQILDHENDYVLFVANKDYNNVKFAIRNSQFAIIRADVRWHSFAEQWEMPKILTKEKLDLVHFPYFNVPIFYNKPFVVTIHDLIITHFPTGRATTLPWSLYQIKRLGYKMALNHAIKNSKKIIAVSESTKREIIDHFGVNPEKVVVTYESGELDISKNHKSEIINDKLKKPYLLCVGNAHPHKNLERLLEVIASIKYQVSGIRLILVGKEDYFYERLRKRVGEMGLEDRVVFYGEANDAQLKWLYQNATALILPSLMEGFGLPALEAMSQGCLVLASDIPAFREICGDAAIYFDPFDISDIAEKVKQVCYRDLNLPAGKAGANHSEKINEGLKRVKRFSWEKMARQTLEVYKEAVSFPQVLAANTPGVQTGVSLNFIETESKTEV